MSSKLVFQYRETRVRPDLANKIREAFGVDFGIISSIPVTVTLKKSDGAWTSGISMIFDTGAAISLLPKYLSEEIKIPKSVAHEIVGVSRKRECTIPVGISRVIAKLIDSHGNSSPEFGLWVAFADRDDVPSALGMKDVINNFEFESNPVEKKLYLKWKGEKLRSDFFHRSLLPP